MPSSDFTPALTDVGALLLARTVDDDGHELGTFTDETTPNEAQATTLVNEAVQEIAGRLGEDIPERLQDVTKTITTLLAAMNVELTYYPEQVRNDLSAYDAYERRVNAALDKPGWLVKAVKDESTGGAPGPQDDDLLPLWYEDAQTYGELTYDPVTQRWILRSPPPPSADEGGVQMVWEG